MYFYSKIFLHMLLYWHFRGQDKGGGATFRFPTPVLPCGACLFAVPLNANTETITP